MMQNQDSGGNNGDYINNYTGDKMSPDGFSGELELYKNPLLYEIPGKKLKHIQYSCDVPCWFTDEYNRLVDVVNDLQERVGHGN